MGSRPPRDLAFHRHDEDDRAAIAVQERAERPARLDALSRRLLAFEPLALAIRDQPSQFFKCHVPSLMFTLSIPRAIPPYAVVRQVACARQTSAGQNARRVHQSKAPQ